MGRQFAYDLGLAAAGASRLPQIRLRIAIEQHLRYNHYPPLPIEMAEYCEQAIHAYMEDEPDRIIETPFHHKIHGKEIPASALVDALHLEGFVQAFLDLNEVDE